MFLGQGVLLQQLVQAREAPITHAIVSRDVKGRDGASFADYTDRLKRSMCALAAPQLNDSHDDAPLSKRKRDPEPWTASKRPQSVSQPMPDLTITSPPGLPPPKRLETFLERYFKIIHPWIPILHPSSFIQRAQVHPQSPGVSLILQAIVAVTWQHVPAEDAEGGSSAPLRRAVIAAAIDDSSLEACQALLLIAYDAVSRRRRMQDSTTLTLQIKRGTSNSPWSLCAAVCRKVEDLQLNAEDSTGRGTLSDYFLPVPPSLHTTSAWVEIEERRRVFWGTFLLDRFCSIATG